MTHVLAALIVAASLGLLSAAEPKPSIETDNKRVADVRREGEAHRAQRRLGTRRPSDDPSDDPGDGTSTDCTGRTYYSFVLHPDAWPTDTSWKLVGEKAGGAVNATGCLADGEYTFVVYDSYGDGLVVNDTVVDNTGFTLTVAQTRSTASSGGVDADGNILAPVYPLLDSSTFSYPSPSCPGPVGEQACSTQIKFTVPYQA
ncbi:hypothetical protein T492DRAFT_1150585, partial [Pavlovales sp. CCMP2436]